MSQQIQSLLNQIEQKFEKSFSQSNLQEPPINQLNPESAKKSEPKNQTFRILPDEDQDFDHIQNLLIEELGHPNLQLTPIQTRQDNFLLSQITSPKDNQHPKKTISLTTPEFKTYQKTQDLELSHGPNTTNKDQNQICTDQTVQPSDENPFYYQQLTIKLEHALQKIASQKKVGSLKKSYNFYDRIEQFEQKKKRQLERMKRQLSQKQINQVQDRPLINSHSRAIIAQVTNDPIHIRSQRIIEKRKEKELQNKKIKEERELREYESFKQEFDNHMNDIKNKYKGKTIRSPEQYYNEMLSWARNREKHIQSKIEQQKQKLKSQFTFKPIINSKSQKILHNKKHDQRLPIYEREPKQREILADPNCTFKPKINKSNFHKKLTFYQPLF